LMEGTACSQPVYIFYPHTVEIFRYADEPVPSVTGVTFIRQHRVHFNVLSDANRPNPDLEQAKLDGGFISLSSYSPYGLKNL